ncbi:actin binding protein, partial [Reticulomyxa filosa]
VEGDGFELLQKGSKGSKGSNPKAIPSTITITTTKTSDNNNNNNNNNNNDNKNDLLSNETKDKKQTKKGQTLKGLTKADFPEDALDKKWTWREGEDAIVPVQLLEFTFQGNQAVGFSVNVTTHMEVAKVKESGQAHQLGLRQGDILVRIDEEEIGKNWEKATQMLKERVSKAQTFTITFSRRCVEKLHIFVARAGMEKVNGKY